MYFMFYLCFLQLGMNNLSSAHSRFGLINLQMILSEFRMLCPN
jgi:hypothetical protein